MLRLDKSVEGNECTLHDQQSLTHQGKESEREFSSFPSSPTLQLSLKLHAHPWSRLSVALHAAAG